MSFLPESIWCLIPIKFFHLPWGRWECQNINSGLSPFGGSLQIFEYLGQYTYKTAVTATGFIKIRHGGYLAHNGKNKRIAAIHEQLVLPSPMPRVIIPFSLQMLQRTGVDHTVCPKCKEGRMEIIASYLMYNGDFVNVKDLNRQRTRNKASPPPAKNKLKQPAYG